MKKSLFLAIIFGLLVGSGCSTLPSESVPALTVSPTELSLEAYQNGISLLTDNQFNAAREAFQTAVEIDPTFGPGFAGLALTALWQGEFLEEALPNAEKGVELAPEDAFARAVLSSVQLSQHQTGDAVGNGERAYLLDADSAFVQMAASLALVANYEYERAWEILSAAAAQNSDSPEIYYALGRYFTAADDFGHAQAAFEHAISLDPDFVLWQMGLAQFFFTAERYDQVIPLLRALLDDAPDYLPAEMLQVRSALMRHQLITAEHAADGIFERLPDSFASVYLEALLADYLQDFQTAIDLFNRALELSTDPFAIELLIAWLYLDQGECTQAEQRFSELTRAYPGHAAPFIGKGEAALCAADSAAALGAFLEALRFDPFSSEAYFGLADTYRSEGRWADAQSVLSTGLAIEPSLGSAHISQARLLLAQGDNFGAEAELRLALVLNPENIAAHNLLAGLLLSDFRLADGIAAIEGSAALNPEFSTTLGLQGMLYYLSGDHQEPLDILEEAIAADPDNANLYLFRALALRDEGDYAQAAASLDTFIALIEDQIEDQAALQRVKNLFQALDDGYQLSQRRGLELIEVDLQGELGYQPVMRISSVSEQGSGLIVELSIQPAQIEREDYLADLAAIATVTARYLPRMVPVVENGVLIEVNVGSRTLFVARLSLFDIKNYADTLIDPAALLDKIAFDLADSTVQRDSINQIIYDVAELRELKYVEVPEYEIITEEEVREYFLEDFDEEAAAEIVKEYASLAMLGTVPADLDIAGLMEEYIGSNVAGFYTSREEKIYVVSNDRLSSYDQLTLAHECEHALADIAFNLYQIQSHTTDADRELAAIALIEGDATLLSIQYLHAIIPDLGWWAAGSQLPEDALSEEEEIPSYLSDMSGFPYIYGRDFAAYLYKLDGWDEINRAFRDPPVSSEQVMHPEKYLDGDSPRRVYLEDFSAALGDDWELSDENVIGEYGTLLILSEFSGEMAALKAAEGWGGDRYVLLENEDSSQAAMVWQTLWDNPAEAEEFWRGYTTAMYHRREYKELVTDFIVEPTQRVWESDQGFVVMQITGDQVTILIGTSLDQLETLLEILD